MIWSFSEMYFLSIDPSSTRCPRQTPWQRQGLAVTYRTCGKTICSSSLNIFSHNRKPQAIWANDCRSKIHFWTICGFVASLRCSFKNIISWDHVAVIMWQNYPTIDSNFSEKQSAGPAKSKITYLLKLISSHKVETWS
jgi:hypothetical protein